MAVFLYNFTYSNLTAASKDRESDWLFRLLVSTVAMAVPFLVCAYLATKDLRVGRIGLPGMLGLILAVLSLGLTWRPISDGILRSRQEKNQSIKDRQAPQFGAVDLTGAAHRTQDYKGQVVLINLWATWCGPCRVEMPKLDELYRSRKDRGFVVFGISDEDADLQRRYWEFVPVTYPLLISGPNVPSIYRDIARYPAIFLIDRKGNLQTAPSPDQPFEEVQVAVDHLLDEAP
jgi:thiol-disulfide isomerase/thioredoxin